MIRENIAAAHLARGSVAEAARVAQSGLAIVRETEFAMWLPKFEDIARGLLRCQRQPQVRAYLEEFAGDGKAGKERMHLDLETDNVEAEVRRLEALGATRWDHQAERGFDFWVLHDPWGNEFCVLQPEFPELLARQEPRNHGSQSG